MDEMMIKQRNKELIEKYPFLLPRNAWTGEPIEDYDYSYTELDNMPTGWRIAFGEQLCAELMEALGDDVKDYFIEQIKEKYGELRWYSNWGSEKIYDIIDKYTHLSRRICIKCGAPATKISLGWISPYCDECAKTMKGNFKSIDT